MRIFLAAATALALATPLAAQTNNPVLDRVVTDWTHFDAACRGATPSMGADKFCGARDYIGWLLTENGYCLNENMAPGAVVVACNAPNAYAVPDPIGPEMRADF